MDDFPAVSTPKPVSGDNGHAPTLPSLPGPARAPRALSSTAAVTATRDACAAHRVRRPSAIRSREIAASARWLFLVRGLGGPREGACKRPDGCLAGAPTRR